MAGIRISGLASGMDIDSIVSDMMKARRIPLDKLKQKKQTMEWQRDDYRSMNTSLVDFRSELTQMKLSGRYNARTTTSTDETKISAKAANNASMASYSITKVKSLASAASKVSGKLVSGSGKVDATKALSSSESNLGGAITWSAGSVETQALTVDNPADVKLNLNGAQVIETSSMNVKVNGKLFTLGNR